VGVTLSVNGLQSLSFVAGATVCLFYVGAFAYRFFGSRLSGDPVTLDTGTNVAAIARLNCYLFYSWVMLRGDTSSGAFEKAHGPPAPPPRNPKKP
jgi:hypothetical protein